MTQCSTAKFDKEVQGLSPFSGSEKRREGQTEKGREGWTEIEVY